MSREILRMDLFFNRVEVLRNQMNINQGEFAKILKITNGFYSDMKHGRSGPSVTFIIELFRSFKNLNPYWLFFGEQPQFLAPPRTGQPQNQVIIDLILRVSRLKPEKRQALISIIEANLKLLEST